MAGSVARPIRERFESKVGRSGGPDACHPWLGSLVRGKPTFPVARTSVSPRRLMWLWAHGEEPLADRRVWVTCGNQQCMNPKHLRCETVEEHFWRFVDKSGGPDACWPWTAARCKNYGQFWLLNKRVIAHRFAYEAAKGPIPESDVELVVMHSCDNPPCCNPAHLSLGTDRDNIDDMWRKGRGSRGAKHAAAMRAARSTQSSGKDGGV